MTTDQIDDKEHPQLVAFDLDYTCWPLWIYTHVTGPLKPSGKPNLVFDKYGDKIAMYDDMPEILHFLQERDIHVAAASRTHAPNLARQALSLMTLPPSNKRAESFFDTCEIYPGSKIKHFQELHRKTGIPYTEMVFYDDERRNVEVEKLGVTFVLVPDGVNRRIFEQGIEEWRRRHKKGEGEKVVTVRPRKGAKKGL
ncbi:putative magnesium-dependent phosphatase P8B7.31 [Saitoella complicata NRRL Y-17804]|uniref:putative magnesium-dependent phosphatase P8B7.31 n=1 Tax=Saitoella complicata (strain BCRC 22490 / CBS 7301 / JCM 7358 / NBRC 10748 / NRRL Y-17804) TaxID=698492 RepID=UPI000867C679|nr:putative magnesium-dependent phosphatase P8B7.31 [Saitoella complicata NRRL Y-17804]ODQ52270.1 putative magnesium-dependent phosphatase P8B7.31 [Saitoella complicata NRRL Y-17804]